MNDPSKKTYYEDDITHVRAALTYLSSEDRQTWIKAGAALKSEYGDNGFAIWDEWSQTAPNYNPRDAKVAWKSFKEGRINIGTLFYEAKRNGFIPTQKPQPLSKEEWQQKREQMQARRLASEQELAIKQQNAKKVANERWEQAKEAQINHPYLVKKGINSLAITKYLRQEQDNLLIPAKQFGSLQGLQTISPDGEKRFNKDATLGGSSMMFGTWGKAKKDKEIVLVEGVATGASIHLATGKSVIVCFSANNLEKVAKNLAKQTDLHVMIGADNDSHKTGTGLIYAQKAAQAIGKNAQVVMPEFTQDDIKQYQAIHGQDTHPTDFNDLHTLKGIDALKTFFQEQNIEKEQQIPGQPSQKEHEISTEEQEPKPEPEQAQQEDVIKTRSAVDNMIMQSSNRPSEVQIEASKQADIDVDATYAQVDGGTIPSEVLIQAHNIKGFEKLSTVQQFVVKTAIEIANKVLAKVDHSLRDDIKRNFETNYEKAISNGTLNIPPEIQQQVEKMVKEERPQTIEAQPVERDYNVSEKAPIMTM